MYCGPETANVSRRRGTTEHTAFQRLRQISVLLYTNYQKRTKSSF